MEATFYMVWNSSDYGRPTYKHQTKEAAITEAKRLAANHSGQKFYVLEAINSVVKNDIIVSDLNTDPIPF